MNSTVDIKVPISSSVEIPSIIKVIGVGGGGGNAVNNMFRMGIKDVSFAICNTDSQALKASPVTHKIQIGDLGAGGIAAAARKAAEENEDRIREALDDGTKMLFVTATMGGGTGTGAAPVVARISQELGILTIGIVTIPFAFEGKNKIEQAMAGVDALSDHVDAILVINNQKLLQLYPEMPISEAFQKADEVLSNAAKSIAEIITVHGYINVDFADVYTTMKDGNLAIMNVGEAEGEKRVTNALNNALNSPLVSSNDIHGAKKILFNLYCSKSNEIRPGEIEEIHEFMLQVGDDINVIWGITFDDTLGDKVKVTLIATGYEMSSIPGMPTKTISAGKRRPADNSTEEVVDLSGGIDSIPPKRGEAPKQDTAQQDTLKDDDSAKPEEKEKPQEKDYTAAIKNFYGPDAMQHPTKNDTVEDLTQNISQEEIERIPTWLRRKRGLLK